MRLQASSAIIVSGRLGNQTATLLGYSQQRPTLSVLPELSFRGNGHLDSAF